MFCVNNSRIVLVVLSIFWCPPLLAAVTLVFPSNFTTPGGNSIRFRPLNSRIVKRPSTPETTRPGYLWQTQDGKYTVWLAKVYPAIKDGPFLYDFVIWKHDEDNSASALTARIDTRGEFSDFEASDLVATIKDGSVETEITLDLPIHSFNPQPQCLIVKNQYSEPIIVRMGRSESLIIDLDCRGMSTNWANPSIDILSVSDLKSANPAFWKASSLGNKQTPLGNSAVHQKITIAAFDLLPNDIPALLSQLMSHKEGDHDDKLKLSVTYSTLPAGRPLTLPVEIPVVFSPSLLVIIQASALGSVLAWVLLIIANGLTENKLKQPNIAYVKLLIIGILLAPLTAIVLIVAESLGCSISLFHVRLSPYYIPVPFLIGCLIGVTAFVRAPHLLQYADKAIEMILSGFRGSRTTVVFLSVTLALSQGNVHAAERLEIVGLASCPSGAIVGLQKWGKVLMFRDGLRGPGRWIGDIGRHHVVTEISCGIVEGRDNEEGREMVFVTATLAGSGRLIEMETSYGRLGKWRQHYLTPRQVSGAYWDQVKQRLLFTSRSDFAVYEYTLDTNKDSRLVSFWRESYDLPGSVLVDRQHNRILIGAAFSGALLQVPLRTEARRPHKVLDEFGTITSLAIDESLGVLYAADSASGAVWAVPLEGEPLRPRKFVVSSELRFVTGVAVDKESNVWVSSYYPGTIWIYNQDAKEIRRIEKVD